MTSLRLLATLRLSWPARVLVIRLRLRALRLGQDVASAVLLLHHLAWVLVDGSTWQTVACMVPA